MNKVTDRTQQEQPQDTQQKAGETQKNDKTKTVARQIIKKVGEALTKSPYSLRPGESPLTPWG